MKFNKYHAIVSVIFYALFLSTAFAQNNLPDIIEKVESSVIVVYIYDDKHEVITKGSGFFLNENGDIVTNRHLLEEGVSAEIKTVDDELYPLDLKSMKEISKDVVICPVDIPENEVNFTPLSDSLPRVGEHIIVIGNPLGLEGTVTDGIVSAIRDLETYGQTIQITAPLSEGSSGSPVFNMRGEVIGVATFQMTKGQNLNFAMPLVKEVKLAVKHKQL